MNKNKYFNCFYYFLGLCLLFSCSNDEEKVAPEETWEKPQVGIFADDARPIELPQGVKEADDPHAWAASGYFAQSTLFSLYGSLFALPQEPTKRSTPITAPNGRMAASEYWVYEWGTDSTSIAYQFYTQGDQEYFEIFINTGKTYLKWMAVEQDKDGTEGTFKLFEESGEIAWWKWEIREDESYLLTFHSNEDESGYEIVSNKDLSGSVKTYDGADLTMEIEWDSAGNGNWKEYEAGALTDEGSWTV